MPQDNVETVRGLMKDHMTPDAPLYRALDALCGELVLMRAGLNALAEQVGALTAPLEPMRYLPWVPQERGS